MNFSSHFTPLAQAYLLVGHHLTVETELLEILEREHEVIAKANPDVWIGRFANFTIENAREIKELAQKRKMGAGKRSFIFSSDGMTREAGNALLKTLEEPGEDTHFFIIMPSIARTLPTILSRVRVVKHESAQNAAGILDFHEFLSAKPDVRMKQVKDILEKLEKEEITKADIAAFIESILRTKYEENKKKGAIKNLESLAVAASYARDQSASLKMILEYFALLG